MNNIKFKPTMLAASVAILLSGCASTALKPDQTEENSELNVKSSYLKSTEQVSIKNDVDIKDSEDERSEFLRLNSLTEKESIQLGGDLSSKFSQTAEFQVSVNELPLSEFLHYSLGELLGVSYLLEPSVKSNSTPVTLELKEKVSGQRLFQLVQQVIAQNNLNVALNDGIYFVHPIVKSGKASNIAFGYGRNDKDVPTVSGEVIQLVPLKFSSSNGLRMTVSSLVNAQVSLDNNQGLVMVQGKRDQVARAVSLIRLLDSSQFHNKAMALLNFRYIDSITFVEKISELLSVEGIKAEQSSSSSASVRFIPIEHLGKVVVFASSEVVLDRVEYWTKQLDKPASGKEQSFYTYHPKYARASDLGQSLAPLIGANRANTANANSTNNNSASTGTNNSRPTNNRSQLGNRQAVQTIEGDNVRLVVDERSNSLIFYSTGKFYKELQPIIRKLDVMPKQVMLEVVIAEVKLTGSFAKGVEYALSNGSSGTRKETFSFESDAGFNYSVVGLNGNVSFNLNEKDGLINVLSRPTILVRDGVSASISVGDDIPTVGSTTSDPINGERETTTIQYRKTGVDLAVTPTINAQGTVIMTIEQNISNVSPDGLSVSGSPSVFERKISTEVVAGDGQSVMLGGLISENKNTNATAIPVLGSIPLLGHLFRSDSGSGDKTELVVLVTPKIINDVSEWERVQSSFIQGLENIKF